MNARTEHLRKQNPHLPADAIMEAARVAYFRASQEYHNAQDRVSRLNRIGGTLTAHRFDEFSAALQDMREAETRCKLAEAVLFPEVQA